VATAESRNRTAKAVWTGPPGPTDAAEGGPPYWHHAIDSKVVYKRMRRPTAALAIAIATLFATAPPALAAVQPYGTNDAGGFRNVLPAGEAGVDNAVEGALFEANGTIPAHFDDQLPLYRDLVYSDPTLTDSQVGNFFPPKPVPRGAAELARRRADGHAAPALRRGLPEGPAAGVQRPKHVHLRLGDRDPAVPVSK
jgi:hypothetical protein